MSHGGVGALVPPTPNTLPCSLDDIRIECRNLFLTFNFGVGSSLFCVLRKQISPQHPIQRAVRAPLLPGEFPLLSTRKPSVSSSANGLCRQRGSVGWFSCVGGTSLVFALQRKWRASPQELSAKIHIGPRQRAGIPAVPFVSSGTSVLSSINGGGGEDQMR